MTKLTIYSPAPPTTPLHELNCRLFELFARVVPMPLPDSINTIGRLPDAEKRHHLPIVTTVDFLPARDRTGPSWHAHDRANKDLKLTEAQLRDGLGILDEVELVDLRRQPSSGPGSQSPKCTRAPFNSLAKKWGLSASLDGPQRADCGPG